MTADDAKVVVLDPVASPGFVQEEVPSFRSAAVPA